MKLFQIFNDICYYDMTPLYDNLEQAKSHYSPDTIIVEAPDYVFEGWGYDFSKSGVSAFIKPIPPEGWLYDDEHGGFYKEPTIEELKANKIQELSNACAQAITNGVTYNSQHYSLTIEDQMNMSNLQAAIINGATQVPYHADDEECRFYSAEEFLAISTIATNHKIYHESYFNSYKKYIKAIDDKDIIKSIEYGNSIPEEYQTDVLKSIIADNKSE